MSATKRYVVRGLVGSASVAAILAGLVALTRSYSSRKQNELIQEGKRILAEIKAYRELHRRYPASFEEAGIRPDPHLIDFSNYSLDGDGEFSFLLSTYSSYAVFYFSRYDRFDLTEVPS